VRQSRRLPRQARQLVRQHRTPPRQARQLVRQRRTTPRRARQLVRQRRITRQARQLINHLSPRRRDRLKLCSLRNSRVGHYKSSEIISAQAKQRVL
jgi:hypothetical protein